MSRCNPARSDYCASRHLLRQLDNARELRRNPLARDAFVGYSNERALPVIAARVSKTFALMDSEAAPQRSRQSARQTAILVRVDVAHHAPVAVAADLGLSIRQFHRERRWAHDRFVRLFRAAAPARICVDDRFAERLLERAGSLADSGETSSARAILEEVAGAGDPPSSCEALLRLAEVDAWSHRFERAQGRLRDADAVLASALMPDDRRAVLRDASDAIALSVRWFAQGPMAVERYPERLPPAAPVGGRALLVRAAAAVRSGESVRAARLLRRAGDATGQTAEAAVDLLTLQAELADFTAEDPLLSERLLTRAIALARECGLRGRELYAEHQLRSTRWMRLRDPRDARAYREVVDRTDHNMSPRLRSSLAFCTADIEVAIGHPLRALKAAEAAASVSTNAYEALSARGLAAAALLRLGQIADAGAQAAIAAEAARAAGHPRVLALAQRIAALAYLEGGNRRAARIAIEESIDCARRFSSAHVYNQARALLGRIASGAS